MQTRARLAVSAGFVAVMLAFSGCSGSSDGSSAPASPKPAASRAAGSPTPTAAAGVDPVSMIANYVAALDLASRTGKVDSLRAMSAKSCPCYGLADEFEKQWTSGKRTPGARVKLSSARALEMETEYALVEARLYSPAYDYLDAAGKVTGHSPASTATMHYSISKDAATGTWQVFNAVDVEALG